MVSFKTFLFVGLSIVILNLISWSGLVKAGQEVTVSGISAGAFMAVQFHVAFSATVSGAGIIAGGPYYCAGASLITAIEACMSMPELIMVSELIESTSQAVSSSYIDNTSNLKNSKVWLFSGTQDTVVNPGVVKKLQEYYQNYVDNNNINTTYNIPAEHSFITDNYGNSCDYLGPDYINNCGFNGAYNILSSILNNTLNPPYQNSSSGSIVQINQASFIPSGSSYEASLYEYAYAYVPTQCKNNKGLCSIHVVFHGCEQYYELIGNVFYMNTGYNQIADTNNLIILYPQASTNLENSKGCFDWWGYTGKDYAYQSGVQMTTVKKMIDYLFSTY